MRNANYVLRTYHDKFPRASPEATGCRVVDLPHAHVITLVRGRGSLVVSTAILLLQSWEVVHLKTSQICACAFASHTPLSLWGEGGAGQNKDQMAAQPRQYNIIMAGKHGVGKSFLFKQLSRDPERSIRGWDKYSHIVSLGEEQVQVADGQYVCVWRSVDILRRWYCGTLAAWRKEASTTSPGATLLSAWG